MNRGFTVVEFCVTVAIVAIIAALVIPTSKPNTLTAPEKPAAWTVSRNVFEETPNYAFSGYIVTQTATGRQWLYLGQNQIVEITQPTEKK